MIRRLLRQKYEFVTQDLAVAPEPDRATLLAWYDANRERYRGAPRLSFTQAHFAPDRRGAEAERDAQLVLASVRGGTSPGTLGAGDGRLLDAQYRDVTAGDVAALFGQDFADAVVALEPGTWSGPAQSGEGLHLVRIDARTGGALPPRRSSTGRARLGLRAAAGGERRHLRQADRALRGGYRGRARRAWPGRRAGAAVMLRLVLALILLVLTALPAPALGVAGEYFVLGVEHILLRIDHLLFVLNVTLIVRGTVLLVKTITAFTVAHSITLGLATLDYVAIPSAPVEA